MSAQPQMALSIRQPWAWLIAHGFKDIENRTWPTKFRGPVWIHAGQTMTRADYEACVLFIAGIARVGNWRLPAFDVLKAECGGIVGSVEIAACIHVFDRQSGSFIPTEDMNRSTADERKRWLNSDWYQGDFGFCLRGAQVVPFVKCKGALSFFRPNLTNLPAAGVAGAVAVPASDKQAPAAGELFAAGPATYPVAQAASSAAVPAAVLTGGPA